MIYDKTCGHVRLAVSRDGASPEPVAAVGHANATHDELLTGLRLEDLRDLRHLIDAALRAAK